MTINEENANAYAMSLVKDVFSRDIKSDKEGKGFGGAFNRKRLEKNKIDPIFNYNSSDKFTEDVLNYIKERYPRIFRRYQNLIKDVANDYAVEKLQISRRSAYASVVSERYFNY